MRRWIDLVEDAQRFPDAFWRWFAGSKVVDDDGNPLPVYHGTNRDFDRFVKTGPFGGARARTLGGQIAGSRQLFYFTSDPNIAAEFAGEMPKRRTPVGPNIIRTYLALKNPLVLDAGGKSWHLTQPDILRVYDEGTHDGVIIRNSADGIGTEGVNSDVYVAFADTQIKSVHNKGTWNAEDPRLGEDAAPAVISARASGCAGSSGPSPFTGRRR